MDSLKLPCDEDCDSLIEITEEDKTMIWKMAEFEYAGKKQEPKNSRSVYKCKQACKICTENTRHFQGEKSFIEGGKSEFLSEKDKDDIRKDLIHDFFKQEWEAEKAKDEVSTVQPNVVDNKIMKELQTALVEEKVCDNLRNGNLEQIRENYIHHNLLDNTMEVTVARDDNIDKRQDYSDVNCRTLFVNFEKLHIVEKIVGETEITRGRDQNESKLNKTKCTSEYAQSSHTEKHDDHHSIENDEESTYKEVSSRNELMKKPMLKPESFGKSKINAVNQSNLIQMDDPNGKFYIDRENIDVKMYDVGLKKDKWNPTQALYEISTKCGWTRPTFTVTRVDDQSKIPRFLCEAVINGQSFKTDRSVSQKKLAQHMASAKILTHIGFDFVFEDPNIKDVTIKSFSGPTNAPFPYNRYVKDTRLDNIIRCNRNYYNTPKRARK